ncbi:hypothetical protein DKB58_02550 [Capnocytophaga canimorsus]|nr:hypothetical protein DKB58_02550 [Capnocytophaga canimorsus]
MAPVTTPMYIPFQKLDTLLSFFFILNIFNKRFLFFIRDNQFIIFNDVFKASTSLSLTRTSLNGTEKFYTSSLLLFLFYELPTL